MASLPSNATPLLLRIPSTHSPLLPNRPSFSQTLTLRHFFPFSANLTCPPFPAKRHFFYAHGDSIPFTVVESAADFDHHLVADSPRNVQTLHPFVPSPPTARVDGDTRVVPLMALQVSIFPNSVICLGVIFNHVAADGRAFHHFMKSWASLCKTGGDEEKSMPCHDRTVVKDPNGLELGTHFLEGLVEMGIHVEGGG